ncbi:MAG: hypothetical protein NC827_02130 [Candidatus Omnitrophica bacterium]|nr:hypothetical protein [Candidatus Omnitrophota bacterium]MCM8802095.1 hypothetical protein [Candidatus Omnitrophota bacterium]
MKLVFIGGGAHRHLGIIRGLLDEDETNNDFKICLYDINKRRAEGMARLIEKTPEYKKANCKILWNGELEEFLDGANFVSTVFMPGTRLSFELCNEISLNYGFHSSDNISFNGAFLALKGGPIILDICKKMEKYCPDAILANFVNPVAVISALINNYTKIKCLGVCAGYTNHMWDLNRIIFNKDEENPDFDVEVCGVNHLSFILRGRYREKDLFELLNQSISKKSQKLKFSNLWSKKTKDFIEKGLEKVIEIYKKFGVLLFSTEGDGMCHLFYEETLQEILRNKKKKTLREIKKEIKEWEKRKEILDKNFFSLVKENLDKNFWERGWKKLKNLNLKKDKNSIFVKIIRGLMGKKEKIVTSQVNKNSVRSFPERFVLEYSQVVEGENIKPVENLFIPENMFGLISSISQHQTLLADAIYYRDPKILYNALCSYPINQLSKKSKKLWREFLEINESEIPIEFQSLKDYI